MAQIRTPLPVKLFVGVLTSIPSLQPEIEKQLTARFGSVDSRSDLFPFDQTHYYDEEMGSPISRRFFSFTQMIDPSEIASIKIQTNEVELALAAEYPERPRPVNLDPGYLTLGKLVLASTNQGKYEELARAQICDSTTRALPALADGLLYVRGQHEDYDRWRQRGNAGWGYDDVLPYFKKAENQQRGADKYHGSGGPLPVSDWRHHDPLSEAFVVAAAGTGIPTNPDFNGATQEGAADIFRIFPRLAERRAQLAGTMSGGEQAMVSIGRGLMCAPKLLLIDEPSLGLSPRLVKENFNIIRQINERGVTVLLVEQNVHQTLAISNFGFVISKGRVVTSGTPSELVGRTEVREAYFG